MMLQCRVGPVFSGPWPLIQRSEIKAQRDHSEARRARGGEGERASEIADFDP